MKSLCAVVLACATLPAMAQSPAVAVPSQFASAHTLFLGNGGAAILGERAREGASMLYTSAYRALSSGHYRLTSTPADADLSAVVSIDAAYTDVTSGNSYEHGLVRLAVYDTKTHALLWTINEPLIGALRKATFQKNIDESVAKIVTDLNSLAAGKLP